MGVEGNHLKFHFFFFNFCWFSVCIWVTYRFYCGLLKHFPNKYGDAVIEEILTLNDFIVKCNFFAPKIVTSIFLKCEHYLKEFLNRRGNVINTLWNIILLCEGTFCTSSPCFYLMCLYIRCHISSFKMMATDYYFPKCRRRVGEATKISWTISRKCINPETCLSSSELSVVNVWEILPYMKCTF